MTNNLKHHLDQTADEIAKSLQDAALSYFEIGLELYARGQECPWKAFQPVLGNLAISCELLLKSIIAKKLFSCLYPNLSKEAQAMLSYSESMPPGATPNFFIGDLRNFTEKVIDINQATSYFYQLYPNKKQEFKPHLSILAPIRNIAVHAAFPVFQKYHLERVAYIACKLFKLAKDDNVFKLFYIANDQEIEAIINNYNTKRVDKVHKAIEMAKSKSKSLDFLWSCSISDDRWEMSEETCPVCKNEATCYGYTEEDLDEDEEYILTFVKDQFGCENCGLTLDDSEELEMAGIEICEDISLYLEEWFDHK